MAQPAWAGQENSETPRSITASWAINPSQGASPQERNLVFLVILFPLTTFMYLFHSRWMEFQYFNQYSSLVYPPFLLSNTLSIPVGRFGYVFFFLFWAWGCASIVNHGLVPGTDAMDTYIAMGWPFGVSNWTVVH